MRSFVAAALLLSGLSEAAPGLKKRFSSPSDPARFIAYDTPSKGVICDGDQGADGLTMWYEDFAAATVGVFNYKTEKFHEYGIPYGTAPIFPQSAPSIPGNPITGGNVTALQCVVRTGRDGMVYVGAGVRNVVVMVNPYVTPVNIQIYTPAGQNPTGNLQPFNDAWPANQGLFFSQTTGNVVTLFDYKTHLFTNYECPTPQSGPLGMRTDKNNNLWFTNFQGQFISVLSNTTGLITEYHECCPLPQGAFPEVLRASTQNQKYLWANAFGGGGFIRIEPEEPDDAKKFTIYTNPTGLATFPFENVNDYCGRIWYTSPTFDILVYYTPSTSQWTTVTVPDDVGGNGGLPTAGNFEVIMHRGPGGYMWFSIGTLGKLVRYQLDSTCKGMPA